MTSIKRESEEERMLRNIMKQREETIDRNNKFKSQSNQWEKNSKKTKMYLIHSRHDFRFNARREMDFYRKEKYIKLNLQYI